MRTLLAITYEFLPDEIALQIKATLDLLERGVPTGVEQKGSVYRFVFFVSQGDEKLLS